MTEQTSQKNQAQALDGIRVLDLGTFVAGPFCTTILAEFGAEVIKVEPPGTGDSLRRFGTHTDCGDTLMWLNESRNKKCVTLNLRDPKGQEVLKRLAARSDVIVENYRPGVLERWGLPWEEIQRLNPRAILVRISAYGQEGPYRGRPGFARVAHAFSGLAYLAGEPGRTPVTPGSTSLADYGSGLYGAVGVLLALRARESTGVGQVVDLALYESMFRVLDEMVPVYQQTGMVRERQGADTVNVVPHSHYQTRDGKWVAIACTNDKIFARLAAVMGEPELAAPERWGPVGHRLAERAAVNARVASWAASIDCADLLARCDAGGVPAATLYSVADIFADPQYALRENIKTVPSRAGPVAVQNVIPKLSGTPGGIKWLGPALGEHNDAVFQELLGMTAGELDAMREAGIM
ncbi:CaiB/BaiF CoA transferase family protein [Cupriavidus basilensis]|uniref:CaiB/BaiF CoA transferase family protein n=1 Tax=Cupriavidus basilensis TaxID=68895 RepID=UPI0007512BC0|nr:CoA transferase [Cupriavidus basilensis]